MTAHRNHNEREPIDAAETNNGVALAKSGVRRRGSGPMAGARLLSVRILSSVCAVAALSCGVVVAVAPVNGSEHSTSTAANVTALTQATAQQTAQQSGGDRSGTAEQSGETADYEKSQNIYVKLSDDGTVNNMYVVNQFQVNKAGSIIDYGDYDTVTNLTDTAAIATSADEQVVDADTGMFYYQGDHADGELPWDISVSYTLDGKPVEAGDLGGAKGRVGVRIVTKRNVNIAETMFYDKYMLQISFTVPAADVRNIDTENAGVVADAGANKQLTYMVMPGRDGDLRFSAEAERFSMSAISIAAAPFSMSVDGMFDTSVMSDGFQQLADGMQQLADGGNQIAPGASRLADGTSQLHTGIRQLGAGTSQLGTGAGQLSGGVQQYGNGVKQLYSGLGQYAAGARQLSSGVNQYAKGMTQLNGGLAQLNGQMPALSKGIGQLSDGALQVSQGASGVAQGNKQLADQVNQVATQANAIKQQLSAALNKQYQEQCTTADQEAIAVQIEQLNQLLDAASTGNGKQSAAVGEEAASTQDGNSAAGMQTGVGLTEQQRTALEQIRQSLTTQQGRCSALAQAIAGLEKIPDLTQIEPVQGLNQLADGSKQLADGAKQLAAGLEQFDRQSSQLVDGVGKLADGAKQLADNAKTLTSGAQQLADNSGQLVDGAKQLTNNAGQLSSGASQLAGGVSQLGDGVGELEDGTAQLASGASQLSDGLVQLTDGMNQMASETGKLPTRMQQEINKALASFSGDVDPVDFISGKNKHTDHVQFMLTIDAIKVPSRDQQVADEHQPGFFERLKNLFAGRGGEE